MECKGGVDCKRNKDRCVEGKGCDLHYNDYIINYTI